MQVTKKKVAAVLGAGAVAVAGSGVAFAYWTNSGSGSGGSASAGDVSAATKLVITQTSTVSGLVLGGSAQTVSVKVHNPSSYSQSVGAITATPTYPTGCGASNWTIQAVTNTGATLAAGADTTSDISVATVALNDLGTAVDQNACKSAVVTFTFAG